MTGNKIISDFGPLNGMRVICTGTLIAVPFAASMLSEFGAEVIEIERPSIGGDRYRIYPPTVKENGIEVGTSWIQEARNRLSVSMELNLHDPVVKEIFYELIRKSDVYMENMVWIEKLGIRDEDLLAINPKLVILHMSGFGNAKFGGLPEYCNMASYDIIGQAFSGFMQYNGTPETPYIISPSHNDYVSALFALFGIMAAYTSAQKTGKGQVVDVSQFESEAKIMQDAFTRTTLGIGKIERFGSEVHYLQPWGLFKSKDGTLMAIGAVGIAVYSRFLKATGFDPEKYPHDLVAPGEKVVNSPLGKEFHKETEKWFSEHNEDEIIQIMRENRVPCSRVNNSEDCLNNPHFQARGDFITYQDQTLERDVTAFGVFPKFSETPGKVWRGAPKLGQDTEIVLREVAGCTDEQLQYLKDNKLI